MEGTFGYFPFFICGCGNYGRIKNISSPFDVYFMKTNKTSSHEK